MDGDVGKIDGGAAQPPSRIGCVEDRPSDEDGFVCDADSEDIDESDMFLG
jgi:hypothetical protein